jgi:hypothetical protein
MELLQRKATFTMTTVVTFRYPASPIEKNNSRNPQQREHHKKHQPIAPELVNLFVEKNEIS